MSKNPEVDVLVIGGGTAAFEAAVAARQGGAERVLLLEKAPEKSLAVMRVFPIPASASFIPGRARCANFCHNSTTQLSEP